ncbi:hypothetical protein Bca4012_038115 [Brassica carinata]
MEPNGYRKERKREPFGRMNGNGNGSYVDADLDPWTAWAYKPRTISLLLIGACFLIWASGALDPESTTSDNLVTSVKRGVWAMIAVFLAYSLLQAPSTVLIRPHPAIWRLVHGMAVIYLVALTFLLFQDTVFDEFFLAHIFGWWGKAILIRNQPLLWVLSIGFELLELTFRHMLPNFNECWWDSIVLDILICNWFGIWAGMYTVRYFDGKTYEWVGISRQPNIIGKVKRTLGQFTPAHWDKDEWHPLQGPWRFIQVLTLCIIFLTVELNTFFLKFSLWIPPRNPVILYRLILWWLIAIPTTREYNSYLQDRKPVKKVGSFCWLSLGICIVELLICIKFGTGKVVPNRNAIVGSDALGKCGTWACGLLDGLDVEAPREKETISSLIIIGCSRGETVKMPLAAFNQFFHASKLLSLIFVLFSSLKTDQSYGWAEDEVVDPKKYLEESCKPKCVKPLLEYQACVKRIQGDDSGHKHCTGQYFDYWHCIDKCVAPKLFAKLK